MSPVTSIDGPQQLVVMLLGDHYEHANLLLSLYFTVCINNQNTCGCGCGCVGEHASERHFSPLAMCYVCLLTHTTHTHTHTHIHTHTRTNTHTTQLSLTRVRVCVAHRRPAHEVWARRWLLRICSKACLCATGYVVCVCMCVCVRAYAC